MGTRIKTGFNDIFNQYSSPHINTYDLALQRAAECGSDYVRFGVPWGSVEEHGAGEGQWQRSYADPSLKFQEYDYVALRARMSQLGLKALPIVTGPCPTWVAADQQRPCNGGNPAVTYPFGQGCQYFADFVVRCAQFFDACNLIEGVEIWNEPNQATNDIYIANPTDFSSILAASITKVNSAFSGRIRPVSGGLSMTPSNASNWRPYLDAFIRQCGGYALGIHPYQMTDFPGNHDNFEADADSAFNDVMAIYNDVDNYTISVYGNYNDIWVTETGAHSRQPLNEDGQRRVLRKLLGSGTGGFDSKSRCKVGIVHRLYPDITGHETSATKFWKCSVLNEDWSRKDAFLGLKAEWL